MAPKCSCVRACVDVCAYIHLGSLEAYKEMWFLHCMHYLGKKYKTKPVSVEHYFYGYIISLVNAINREGVSSGTWRL